MIHRNRHPSGPLGRFLFALAQLADGLVRTLSLGYLNTDLPIKVTSWQTRQVIKKLKKDLENE